MYIRVEATAKYLVIFLTLAVAADGVRLFTDMKLSVALIVLYDFPNGLLITLTDKSVLPFATWIRI